MKILLLLLPIFSFAQELPKDANTIIVKGATPVKVVKSLESRGFSVAFDGFDTYTTLPRKLENHGTITITVVMKDSAAIISGVFEGKVITPDLFKHKESYGGYQLGGTFEVMNDFAKSLNGQISYSTLQRNISGD